MFFDNLSDVPQLSKNSGCSIFAVSNSEELPLKNAIIIEHSKNKVSIGIEQIREALEHVSGKQKTDQFILIKEAERMTEQASNAFLKNLEEPKENYHFVLQTETPFRIIPTILSRANLYILRKKDPLNSGVDAAPEIKDLAKKMIVASGKDYVELAENIAKKKDNTREYALNVLSVAIEMCYKSYFKTKNQQFLKKLPKLLKAYDSIAANGHIKLHLVADML